jgi:hypothetical protein
VSEPRGAFTPEQVVKLLTPIKSNRVLADGKGHSHVSQQDITAHLIRMFGFGNFDIEVMNVEPIFEQERADKDGNLNGRFDVCYRALVRITIRNAEGVTVAVYENGSTATAQNQTRGDAHDLAYKSAISLSIKRAAIALGDQFGLSLYNKGQLAPLVIATLVNGPKHDGDVQDKIPQQVSLGNDEIDRTEDEAPKPPDAWRARVAAANDLADLSEIHAEAAAEGWATPDLMAALTARKGQL